MRLKSFHAPTMSAALKKVRELMGDDAIIVATREDENSGGVRVTAAIEEEQLNTPSPATVKPKPAPRPEPTGPKPLFGAAPRDVDIGQDVFADDEDDWGGENDLVDTVADGLFRHGVPHWVSEPILVSAGSFETDDPGLALAGALDELFGFEPLTEGPFPHPIMLVGMPGAGKTMVAAKIAARGAFTGQKVGMITTDTQRAGGVDQLAAFTRLLKLDLVETEDQATLTDGLLTQDDHGQVVIDTAGINPFSADDVASLSALLRAGEIEPVLVLPAGGDPQEAGEISRIFAEIGVRRLIVTRLEMTQRLGGLLSAAHTGGLAFADVSLTPKVADGLTPMNPVALARILIPSEEEDASAPPRGARAASA